jgi:hypothetical protein
MMSKTSGNNRVLCMKTCNTRTDALCVSSEILSAHYNGCREHEIGHVFIRNLLWNSLVSCDGFRMPCDEPICSKTCKMNMVSQGFVLRKHVSSSEQGLVPFNSKPCSQVQACTVQQTGKGLSALKLVYGLSHLGSMRESYSAPAGEVLGSDNLKANCLVAIAYEYSLLSMRTCLATSGYKGCKIPPWCCSQY